MKKILLLLSLLISGLSVAQSQLTLTNGMIIDSTGTILNTGKKLNDEQAALIPSSGWITKTNWEVYQGNSFPRLSYNFGSVQNITQLRFFDGANVGTLYFYTSPDGANWILRDSVKTDKYYQLVTKSFVYSTQYLKIEKRQKSANIHELKVYTGGVSDVTAPTVPTGLVASNITTSSFTLTWTASTDAVGVTGYDVYRGGVLIASPSTNSLSVTGLSSGTTYAMTVRAKDNAGNNSAQSSALNVTTVSDAPVLEAAWVLDFGNNFTSHTTNYNDLFPGSFPVSSGTAYNNLTKNDGSSSTINFVTTSSISGGGGSGGSCTGSTPYSANARNSWWRIQNTEVFSGKFTGLPTNKTFEIVIFHNSGSNDATSTYVINGVSKTLGGLTNCSNTVTFSNLVTNTGELEFSFSRTSGYFETGINVVEIRQYSGGTPADTQSPTVPASLASNTITANSFNLTWAVSSDNVGVTAYDVYRNGTLIGSPTTNSFAVVGLSASTTYGMTVRAKDAVGNVSASSSTLNVTTSAGGGGVSGFISVDSLNVFSVYPTSVTSQVPFYESKISDFANNINPSTYYLPGDFWGDVYNGNFIIVDLGKTYAITDVILGGVYNYSANDIRIRAGADWVTAPTDRVEPINWEGSDFLTYTGGNVAGYLTFSNINKTTRYLRVYVSGKLNRVGAIILKGSVVSGSYTSPTKSTALYPSMSKRIGTMGNEGHSYLTNGADMFCQNKKIWRFFAPWEWLEAVDGQLGFAPPATGDQSAYNSSGANQDGWDDYDRFMTAYSRRGGSPYFCFWQNSPYMGKPDYEHKATFPNGSDPVYYASYTKEGKVAFQIGARYGSGTVPDGKINVKSNNERRRNTGEAVEAEDWNEDTKGWKGVEGMFTIFESYARMRVMNDGAGIADAGYRQADPSMEFISTAPQVVIPDLVKGYYFCQQRLGGGTSLQALIKAYGVHLYNNPNFQPYGPAVRQAVSPEEFNLEAKLTVLSDHVRTLSPGSFIDLTEFGYDLNPNSNMSPKLYGTFQANNDDLDEIRAQWTVREFLIASAVPNMRKALIHQYLDVNINNTIVFESNGPAQVGSQIDPGNQYNRNIKLTRQWWYTANTGAVLTNFHFKDKIASGNNLVWIYRFEHDTHAGLYCYALWCPTSNQNLVSNYSLALPAGYVNAQLTQLSITEVAGDRSTLTVSNSTVGVNVSEKACFVMAYNTSFPAGTYNSVFKPLTLTAGMANNLVGATDAADCTGSTLGDPLIMQITGYPNNAVGNAWQNGTEMYLDFGSAQPLAAICGLGASGSASNVDVYVGSPGSWTLVNQKLKIIDNRWTSIYFPAGTSSRYVRIVKGSGVNVLRLSVSVESLTYN